MKVLLVFVLCIIARDMAQANDPTVPCNDTTTQCCGTIKVLEAVNDAVGRFGGIYTKGYGYTYSSSNGNVITKGTGCTGWWIQKSTDSGSCGGYAVSANTASCPESNQGWWTADDSFNYTPAGSLIQVTCVY